MAQPMGTTRRKALSKAEIAEGAGAELLNLLRGITSDGKLDEGEVDALRYWLSDNAESGLTAVQMLQDDVTRILEDGVVSCSELVRLQSTVESLLPPELRKEAKAKRREVEAEAKTAERNLKQQSRRIDYANFMVAGVHVGNRQQTIESEITVGKPVMLQRDPHNRYDRNAIAVTTSRGAVIGFVPRDDAGELASLFDDCNQYAAIVTKILGYNKSIPVVQADFYGPGALSGTVGQPLRRCGSGQGAALGAGSSIKLAHLVVAMLIIAVLMTFCGR